MGPHYLELLISGSNCLTKIHKCALTSRTVHDLRRAHFPHHPNENQHFQNIKEEKTFQTDTMHQKRQEEPQKMWSMQSRAHLPGRLFGISTVRRAQLDAV